MQFNITHEETGRSWCTASKSEARMYTIGDLFWDYTVREIGPLGTGIPLTHAAPQFRPAQQPA